MESLLRSNVAHLFIAAFFLLSAGCRIPTSWMGGGSRQPNIVLMMADDLGWADLGIQGHPFLRTPNIDAVAENGLRFTRFYSAAPVCSPTRGSVLTGRHPFRYGVFSANTHHLPEEEITLAEVLRDNGYRTGFFGKWHLGTLTVSERDGMRGGITSHTHFQPPARHGFHVSFATEAKVPTYDPMLMPEGQTRMVWWNPVGESHQTPESYGSAYWNTDDQKVVDNLGGDDSRVMMDRAIPFIESAAQSNTPFLAVIWFHAPHLPLVSDSTSRAAYADMSPRAQHYFGCIEAMDKQVGRLRQALADLDVADNTMLWFMSDNGPEGLHADVPGSAGVFRGRKRSLFEGGVRVPGLIEWPRAIQAGRVSSVPVVTSDIMPTIMAILDIQPADSRPMDGENMAPLLAGLRWQRQKPIAFESSNQTALSGNRYKLVRASEDDNPGKTGDPELENSPYQLFDLIADPGETHDLAQKDSARVRIMLDSLLSWQQSVAASLDGEDY